MERTITDLQVHLLYGPAGNTILEAELLLSDGARASAQSADGNESALAAAEQLAGELIGLPLREQESFDEFLLELDGTPSKKRFGAAIPAISMALSKAAAESRGLPLFRYLGGIGAVSLPAPLVSLDPELMRSSEDGSAVYLFPTGSVPFFRALPFLGSFQAALKPIWKKHRLTPKKFAELLSRKTEAEPLVQETLEKTENSFGAEVGILVKNSANPALAVFPANRELKSRVEKSVFFYPEKAGTVTEMFRQLDQFRRNGKYPIVGSCSRCSETFAADFAAAVNAQFFAAGPLLGMEHFEKYHQLVRIEKNARIKAGGV